MYKVNKKHKLKNIDMNENPSKKRLILSLDFNDETFIDKVKNIVNKQESRINWREYFMTLAYVASVRSPCQKIKVGSIIVKDNRVISMGYNGFPSGCSHELFKNKNKQNSIHSEQNGIGDAARRGVSIKDSTIYVTHYPCINCTKMIISSGIKKVIYGEDYKNNPDSEKLLYSSEIEIEQF